jgi:hypothetical protein
MKRWIVTISIVASVIALTFAFAQRRELVSLKEESNLLQRAVEPTQTVDPSLNVAIPSSPQYTPSAELLRLRGEVGQLERRKRELGGVRTENATLRAQLAVKGTNAPGSIVLPADYIRKANAKFAGFATPEDTVQSMLWAIHHQDVSTFAQVFSPEAAKKMQAEIERRGSADEFFKGAEALPGLRIIGKEAEPDGITVLRVEILPGDESHLQKIRFKQFDGHWKLLSGF